MIRLVQRRIARLREQLIDAPAQHDVATEEQRDQESASIMSRASDGPAPRRARARTKHTVWDDGRSMAGRGSRPRSPSPAVRSEVLRLRSLGSAIRAFARQKPLPIPRSERRSRPDGTSLSASHATSRGCPITWGPSCPRIVADPHDVRTRAWLASMLQRASTTSNTNHRRQPCAASKRSITNN